MIITMKTITYVLGENNNTTVFKAKIINIYLTYAEPLE